MITQSLETLRTKSVEFDGTPEELAHIIGCLEFELYHSPEKGGVGLSGIQINIPYRVCIIRTQTTQINLFNAKIIKAEQPFVFEGEGCLSLPGQRYNTNRYNLITVLNGDNVETQFSGFDSVAVQHELGHWDADLFIDHKIEETK